jgi:cell division protein WhiA
LFLKEIGFENLDNKQELIVSKMCCKRAYIRGAFISGGSITNPTKTYHIEFLNNHIKNSDMLVHLINGFEINSKTIKRKSKYVVYIKEGEGVVDLLNVMGAHINLMELENIRIVKDVRNTVNRKVNCETANLTRTINASIKQIEDIKYIEKSKGLNFLDQKLEVVARKRLQHPNESLKQIGIMLTPPVGKSGVNHRLRKISDIAQTLRG